jgi:hypothetical protein
MPERFGRRLQHRTGGFHDTISILPRRIVTRSVLI